MLDEIRDKVQLFTEYYKYHNEIPRLFMDKISNIMSKYLRIIHKLVIMIRKEELNIIELNVLLKKKIVKIQTNLKKQLLAINQKNLNLHLLKFKIKFTVKY